MTRDFCEVKIVLNGVSRYAYHRRQRFDVMNASLVRAVPQSRIVDLDLHEILVWKYLRKRMKVETWHRGLSLRDIEDGMVEAWIV